MSALPFQQYLSQVASRLRHDLKGGLITLKMGLESLPEEEALKPLLLEKTAELADLSDKLILLLRMGELVRTRVRPGSLFQQAANQIQDRFPPLLAELYLPEDGERWDVDPDAITYAMLELAQNAKLAGATKIVVKTSAEGRVEVTNDGDPLPEDWEALLQLGQSRWARSGLGLSIVESCLQQHGGTFELQRDESGAAKFVLGFQVGEIDE